LAIDASAYVFLGPLRGSKVGSAFALSMSDQYLSVVLCGSRWGKDHGKQQRHYPLHRSVCSFFNGVLGGTCILGGAEVKD